MQSKTILILASNPREDLDLDYEIHVLKNIIEESENLQEFDVIIDDAISPSKMQGLFLEHEPRIVHFCGHGSGENGLVFVDYLGKEQLVSTQALSNLFKEFDDTIECVLLNACYSEVQADEISKHINYAIGMNQAIADDAAIFFAKGFYQALGKGKQIRQCFRLGKNAIELELSKLAGKTRKFEVLDEEYELIPEHLKPTIKIKTDLNHFHEDIAREKYTQDDQQNFNFGEREQPTLGKREYRFRKILLNKVNKFWINGVLKNSLHTKVLLELGIQEKPTLVNKVFSEYQELSVDSSSSYKWLNTTDIYENMGEGRTLLILGKPGSGKTIALLKLAQRFLEKAEQNLSLPIPVVFHLSSWTNKKKSIAEWLAIELKEKYQVSKTLAKEWIKNEQLLLLLDGLDEVQPEYRSDCVKAINIFLDSHGTTEIVVCSRFQEYKNLPERLKLRNAIYIKPLSSEYINWYFNDVGEALLGLKKLLHKNVDLMKFAKTPLIFSIMTITYSGYSSEDIFKEISEPKYRYKRLFNSYTERMYSRSTSINKFYGRKKFNTWLTFLAKYMQSSSTSIFLIENMSVELIEGKCQKYLFSSGAWIVRWTILLLIVLALYSNFHYTLYYDSVFKKESISEYAFLVLTLISTITIYGLILIPIFARIFPLHKKKINSVEILNWSSFNLRNLFSLLCWTYVGLFISGIVIISGGTLSLFFFRPAIERIKIISDGLLYGKFLKKTEIPNQGIWNSINNLRLFTFLGIVINVVALSFIYIWIQASDSNIMWIIALFLVPLFLGLLCIVATGMAASFSACSKHFLLRLILWRQGFIPWNFTHFLDLSTKNLFMNKLGGGYIFIHRMLMEHFASMEIEK